MLPEALRQLSRDPPRRNAVLFATLTILAVAFVSSGASSSSSSSKAPRPLSPSSLSSSPALCNKDARASAAKHNNPKNNNMGLLGAPTSAGDPEESRHAALFAVGQLQDNAAFAKTGALSLARLVSAQRQVVAGTNHVLVLETRDASGAVKTVRATVYEKLPDHARNGARDMELTKFQVADGGAPAAEGAEAAGAADCAGGAGAAAAASWQDEAARAAVAGINARSNSLVPYELAAVLEAKRGEPASELKLELKRGGGAAKSETFRVSVKEQGGQGAGGVGASASSPDKRFGLVSFAHEP